MPILKKSLESIFSQIDSSFEVVVVDSMSNDGSRDILQEFSRSKGLKIFYRKCNRGIGRQMAMENSEGEYIISHMDMDEVFLPSLRKLLNFYHRCCEGKILAVPSYINVWRQNITVGLRQTITKLGGWRDLQYGEDWDLWSRAAQAGVYCWTVYQVLDIDEMQAGKNDSIGLRHRIRKYRDMLRLGRMVFERGEEISLNQYFALAMAKLMLIFDKKYISEFNRTFSCNDPRYYVEWRD